MGVKICTTDDTSGATMGVDAMVSCSRCGAKAHDPANVCDPVQIPQAGWLGD